MTKMRKAPRHDIDIDGDGSTSWACLPLVPHVGVVNHHGTLSHRV
jgi:hypothetical protein